MNNIIEQMLSSYEIKNTNDEINALKEIIQELVLSGLSRGGFFDEAAFYGGTALRIFYKLDRFSEDLDFALLKPNKNFDISKYFNYIEKELNAYGLKGDTLEHILKFFPKEENHTYDHNLKNIKIKFEIDINPPKGATYEMQYKLLPSPHQIKLYDKSSLLAGKIHAILCRNWKKRTKGRDLYDYVFFLANNINVNLELIKNKLIESKYISEEEPFNLDVLKTLLKNKFKEINYTEAKEDVIPFIKNLQSLDLWSSDFFIKITDQLR